jgi:hypothetical protein
MAATMFRKNAAESSHSAVERPKNQVAPRLACAVGGWLYARRHAPGVEGTTLRCMKRASVLFAPVFPVLAATNCERARHVKHVS